jgi:benzylsuccinate CoA-transferase BbsF subunit
MVVRWSANREAETRRGNASEYHAPHGVYPCRGNDQWIALSVRDDAAWRALADALDEPEGSAAWARDPALASAAGRLAAGDALDARLSNWTRAHDALALAERLQAAGVEAGPVQDLDALLSDPQLAQRGHFVAIRHAHLGELQFERSGFRLSGSPGGFSRPGPNLGEHSQAVLGGILGLSRGEIEALVARGVVA